MLMLKPGWKMAGVAKASVEDIKPGDFVGIASLPTASGGDGAVEVLVFPPAMKGTGEGSYPWDLKPKSSMTNATVTNAVKGVDGRTLDLSYSGGKEKKICDSRWRSDRHFRPGDRGGPQARRDRLRSRPKRRRRRAGGGLRCGRQRTASTRRCERARQNRAARDIPPAVDMSLSRFPIAESAERGQGGAVRTWIKDPLAIFADGAERGLVVEGTRIAARRKRRDAGAH